MERLFFSVAFTAYTVASSLFIGYALTRRETLSRIARWLLVTAVVSHAASLIVRTVIARGMPQHSWYVPWSNWFESFSFFSLVIVVQYLIIQRSHSLPILGAFVSPLAFFSMVVAINSPYGTQIPSLPPA